MNTIITAPPKSVQVADIIRRGIQSGHFKKGERLFSTRKIAEKYSVTNQIVRSAFDILQKEGLIESHVGRGTFVSSISKSLATKTILLMLTGVKDKHDQFPVVLPSVLQKYGYIPYIFDISYVHEQSTLDNIKDLLAEKPRAFIVDALSSFNFDILKWLDPTTQLIIIKRFESNHHYDASYILEDYVEGGRRACEYLLKKGRKKIAVVSYERHPGWTSELLLTGIKKALAEYGLEVFKYLNGDADESVFCQEFGKDGCPDGVLCTVDYYYSKVRKAADKYKLIQGCDFDTIGYGNTPWAEVFGITSMSCIVEEVAEKIAEELKQKKNVNIKIAPQLVIRRGNHVD